MAILLLAGFFIYAPVLHGEWLWDDGATLRDNPLMHDPGALAKIWFAPPGPDYFPLTTSVEWLLWQIFGDHTFPFHLACLLLHLASAFLLWCVFGKLGLRFAWWGALLFVVHPVLVESVAWVSELKNTISLPFLLGAIIAWLNYDERARPADFAAALLLFLAALLAKTSVVMFPFVLLLYTWWKHGHISRQKLFAIAPFFAASFVLGLLTLVFQRQWAIGETPQDFGTLAQRGAGAGHALLFYFGKSLWPFGLRPIYPLWSFQNPSFAQFLPWLLLAAVFVWLALRRTSCSRAALFGLGFFVLNLAPVLGFFPMSYLRISWVADHFVYLPVVGLIGLALAGTEALLQVYPCAKTAATVAAAAFLLALAGQSRAYAANFRGSVELWSYAVQCDPDSWLVQYNLGLTLMEHQQRPAAEAALRRSLALNGSSYGTHLALANLIAQTGRNAESAHEFAIALSLVPQAAAQSIEAHVNYGIVLSRLGDNTGSEHQYYLATLCTPLSPLGRADLAVAHFNLANILLQRGQRADAIRHLQAALAAQPSLVQARNELASLQAPVPAAPK